MTSTNPPRIAARLLNRFAPNEALAGDLLEEYRSGRSNVWYWRQVLVAVTRTALRCGDWHNLFAPQNLFMQYVMLGLVSVCVVFTVKVTAVVIFRDGAVWLLTAPHALQEVSRIPLSFAVALPIGAAIARVHVRSADAAVVAFSVAVMLWALVNLFVLDREGNLDSAIPHIIALLVYISGLLIGGHHSGAATPAHR